MTDTPRSGLPINWIVRPGIDLELKQYTLLAYLQRVRGRFAERKLYPYLEDVRMHLNELLQLRRKKKELASDLSRELLGFDPITGQALYDRPEEEELLGVVDALIDMAVPDLQRIWMEGSVLRTDLADRIHFEPLGVQPLVSNEGWLMFRTGNEARVYSYSFRVLREFEEEHQYRSVVTRYVSNYPLSITNTFEHIKTDLVQRYAHLPTPATFVFHTDTGLPHIETFMPLAKQMVYEFLVRRS